MKIKRVLWRNITSYGNRVQTIDFENNPGFYMLMGENATGKSSFLSCITFGLYGKVNNKKLKDLANRKNKNGWVRVELESKGRQIVIERGVAPTSLEVTVDGKRYDESGKKNVQDYLEEELYGMPYYVFDNLISLNINDFKSFINMSPGDKRAIIDRLFSLDVINQMRELLKSDSKDVKSMLDSVTAEIDWLESSIEKNSSRLKETERKLNEQKTTTANELKERAKELEESISASREEKEKIDSVKDAIQKKKSTMEDSIRTSKYEIKTLEEKIRFFDKKTCPTCEREMSEDFSETRKEELSTQMASIRSMVDQVMPDYEKVLSKWEQVQTVERSFYKKEAEIKAALSSVKREIDELSRKQNVSEDTKAIREMIEENEQSLSEKKKEKAKAESMANFNKVVDQLLGEKGVKQLAIQSILPMFNKYIKELSIEMSIDYDIKFDEEFNAVLTHLGEEISPVSLSTGETKKVDIVVLLSLIKLVKMKFPMLNILFLDEVFSSVDTNNVYHMIRSLGKITRELKLNTIVVNHSSLPHEEFDYILRTSKNNGFSSIELEKIG
jgi:DNA repair exonuclease SbcCD ATPase subunit